MSKVSILTYHSIDRSGSIVSTAPDVFRRQMQFLRRNDFAVVSLNQILQLLEDEKPIAPKTVALTFDDGFQNFYTEAFPILEENSFPATVFLVTDFCGKSNDWAGNPPALPRQNLLSWRAVKELSARGIEFGAHTRTHPDLTAVSAARAEREIVESKTAIEDRIGAAVNFFAYPYGKFDAAARAVAAQNFRAACAVKLGKAKRTSDFFALERIDCYYLQNPKMFGALAASAAFEYYLQFRQSLRDVKARLPRR